MYRDIFNCHASAADGLFASAPATCPDGEVITCPAGENGDCDSQGTASATVFYAPSDSVTVLTAWTAAAPATSNTVASLDGNAGVDTAPCPQIQFAGSDTHLNPPDVGEAESAVGEAVFQLPVYATPIVPAFGRTQNVKLSTTDVCRLFAGAANRAPDRQGSAQDYARHDTCLNIRCSCPPIICRPCARASRRQS